MKKGSAKPKSQNIVQVKNPKTGMYTKINKSTGKIVSSKKGPYKGIPIVGEKK